MKNHSVIMGQCRTAPTAHRESCRAHLTSAERAFILSRWAMNRVGALFTASPGSQTRQSLRALPLRSGAKAGPIERLNERTPSDDQYRLMWENMLVGMLQGFFIALVFFLLFG